MELLNKMFTDMREPNEPPTSQHLFLILHMHRITLVVTGHLYQYLYATYGRPKEVVLLCSDFFFLVFFFLFSRKVQK